jgi:hypothetical protein
MADGPRQWPEQFGSPTPHEHGLALALRAKVEAEAGSFFSLQDLLLTLTVACPATGAEAFSTLANAALANAAWLPAVMISAV